MADENIEDQNPDAVDTGENTPDTDGAPKPPWERDGEEFSPEKAWSLIQHLREDNTKLKASNESNSAKLREIEDAKLSEQEKLQRDLEEAKARLAEADMAKAWAEARATHPQLSEDDLELIGVGSPDEIKAKAAKLAARIAAQATASENHTNPALRAKPTGGVDPTVEHSKDWLRDRLTNQ